MLTEPLKKHTRAANYLSAIQIYLRDNVLLKEPLSSDHIKPRLLGHWGTVPGINFIYANLNRLISENNQEALFILGPGHGFAGLQANLFIEGTLGKYYKDAVHTEEGVRYLARSFSWPYGFPSHSSPATPGVILEGGELGYALSTAYGAALDNENLLVVAVIGDGEAETGPTATAWHLHRLISPKENGMVLPILHLNGYKISGPTIFGRMTDPELMNLFSGYGFRARIVDFDKGDIYENMAMAMDECYASLKGRGDPPPMIILKTPKGWTGVKEFEGKKIEGNSLSHQVTLPLAKENEKELRALEDWLKSYRFDELFGEKGFDPDILALIPQKKMGDMDATFGRERGLTPLSLPSISPYIEDAGIPGTNGSSSMRRAGLYLTEVFKQNAESKNFRLFSPDETYSNKLDSVFAETARSFNMRIEDWDKDLSPRGRVVEMLSEHSLQGMMQGYILTGRHGIFASYEAFIQIVASMADQYLKFLKGASEIPWRKEVASLNYILTSSGWRQEHNGFSHQNPGFLSEMLLKPGCFAKVYFPPDGNSALVTLKHCLESKNRINVIVAGKTFEPRWLTEELAEKEFSKGLMVWDFASDPGPDIVFAAAGDYLTKEALAATKLLKQEIPRVRVRFISVLELSAVGIGDGACGTPIDFAEYFTADKPVIFNFHGYPQTLKQILWQSGDVRRVSIHGYNENGSTTTPFDMHVRNGTSRYHLVMDAARRLSGSGAITKELANSIVGKYNEKLLEHREHIIEHGVDPREIESWSYLS